MELLPLVWKLILTMLATDGTPFELTRKSM
jgi:hypothetical protein